MKYPKMILVIVPFLPGTKLLIQEIAIIGAIRRFPPDMLNKLGKAISNAIRRLGRRNAGPPEDPFSKVRVPVRRGPPSLAAGVALEEPDDSRER
jgi:hypothetical protein